MIPTPERIAKLLSDLWAPDGSRCAPVTALPRLEEEVRCAWPEVRSATKKRELIGIETLQPDGRKREKAVRALAHRTDGTELPFLILRLNDWVAQVRVVADAAVWSRLRPDYTPHFIRCLPLVHRLSDLHRTDHSRLQRAVLELLSTHGRDAFLARLHDPDRHVRRIAYKMLGDAEGFDHASLLGPAVADEDLLIRTWAMRRITELGRNDVTESYIQELKRDPQPGIRIEALRMLLGHGSEEAVSELRDHLLDRSGAVRYFARYYLKKFTGTEDFAAIYRRALTNARGRQLLGALGGIEETGSAEDATDVLPHLGADSSRVVRAAMRAAARIAPAVSEPKIRALLTDPRRGVRRTACDLLHPKLGRLDWIELLALMEGDGELVIKERTLSISRHLPRWEGLVVMLHAPIDVHPELLASWLDSLTRWLDGRRRYYWQTGPYPRQLELADRAFATRRSSMPAEIAEELDGVLEGFRNAR